MNLLSHMADGELVELRIGAITTRTKVTHLENDTEFQILQPTHKLLPILFEENENVLFFFFRETGMFSFRARYSGRSTQDAIRLCSFVATTEVEKNQRRFSYRLPVALEVNVRRKTQYDQAGMLEYAARTVNLSQEGILFACVEKFQPGVRLMMELSLDEDELCMLSGDVLRCEAPLYKDDPFLIAAKFVNLLKRDQAQLAKFILNRQILDRRRRQMLEERA